MLTRRFSPEVHLVATNLRPRCVDQHLVVRWLRGVTRTSSSLGHRKNLPTSEVAQRHARSNWVALRDPHGVSTIPLIISSLEHHTISLHASAESQATKLFRRWQHLRVISTTGLQHKHIVPLDAISQYNHTRIAHSHNQMVTIKHMWVRGFTSTPQAWILSPGRPMLFVRNTCKLTVDVMHHRTCEQCLPCVRCVCPKSTAHSR